MQSTAVNVYSWLFKSDFFFITRDYKTIFKGTSMQEQTTGNENPKDIQKQKRARKPTGRATNQEEKMSESGKVRMYSW